MNQCEAILTSRETGEQHTCGMPAAYKLDGTVLCDNHLHEFMEDEPIDCLHELVRIGERVK